MTPYWQKLRDPRWQRKRLEVLRRDQFTCRSCNATDKTLEVHHCSYNGDPWEAHDDQLLTLCTNCHKRRTEIEKEVRTALNTVMAWMTWDELQLLLGSIESAGMDRTTSIVVRQATEEDVRG